jgi:formylmethanofuran--tetrahydromethanopterin N-formyltransferase
MAATADNMLNLNGVAVADTFAEAFPIRAARLIITADSPRWASTAATVLCGNATSVIACDAEAAIEQTLDPQHTPDARPGVSVLIFGFSVTALATAIQNRVGQCVLTRYWRIPVMDGEFVCEDEFATVTAVAGGNLLICGTNSRATLAAAELAADAARSQPGVALPFPGGIVRSGSKVGSRYPKLRASTNEAWCPTLRGLTSSQLPVDCNAVYEIVIDGLTFDDVQQAMRRGLHAAAAAPDIRLIAAGNYGGKLGKHHFHLRDLL